MAKQKHVLNVVTRSELGKGAVNRLRKAGHIPAVVYSKGSAAKTIYFNAAEWEALQKFELNLIALKEGENEILALIKDVQNDFMRGKASHVDFLEVRRDQVIKASVAIHAGHTAPAGIAQGGLLEQFVHEIEVECLPDALPEFIEADVSKLELDQEMREFQRKLENNGFVSRERAEQENLRLSQKQRDLQQLQEKLATDLQTENQKNSLQLRDSINAFLQIYNKEKGYDLIISNTGFDNLLYANKAFNITQEIVDGLNARYTPQNKK